MMLRRRRSGSQQNNYPVGKLKLKIKKSRHFRTRDVKGNTRETVERLDFVTQTGRLYFEIISIFIQLLINTKNYWK